MQTVFIQTIAAFCGCFFFAIVLGAPYKEVLWGGLSGVLSQFLLSVITLTLENPVIATFVASFAVAIVSQILSRRRRQPSTLFLIPGILPQVPGSAIYYAMYDVFQGQMVNFYSQAVLTCKLAGVIAMGIMIAYSLPKPFFDRLSGTYHKTQKRKK
ncbi:MAG: threonine/serine exporter family protein [Clostridiales bacterium]|nr:threonine/serine exporter family protein [Clostridiales bacterium]